MIEKALKSAGSVKSAKFGEVLDLPHAALSRLLARLTTLGVLEKNRLGRICGRPSSTRCTGRAFPGRQADTRADPLAGGIRDGIREVLDLLGATCFMDHLGDDWHKAFPAYFDQPAPRAYDGLVVYAAAAMPQADAALLLARGKPFVLISVGQVNLPCDMIAYNLFGCYQSMAEHLIARGADRLLSFHYIRIDPRPIYQNNYQYGPVAIAEWHGIVYDCQLPLKDESYEHFKKRFLDKVEALIKKGGKTGLIWDVNMSFSKKMIQFMLDLEGVGARFNDNFFMGAVLKPSHLAMDDFFMDWFCCCMMLIENR